jgi:hypothetical protein
VGGRQWQVGADGGRVEVVERPRRVEALAVHDDVEGFADAVERVRRRARPGRCGGGVRASMEWKPKSRAMAFDSRLISSAVVE